MESQLGYPNAFKGYAHLINLEVYQHIESIRPSSHFIFQMVFAL